AWRRRTACAVSAAVILLLAYKGFALLRTAASAESGYLLMQKDYENYETIPYEIEGVTFYYPVDGDRVGYDSFPSSPAKAEIAFLGDAPADGFYLRQ
ncbi:MAG: hypothetical protein NC415_07995, partial [bacterium]|nr:hypothetical protein [bacterium]